MSYVAQLTLQASAAKTVTGIGTEISRPEVAHAAGIFQLDVTAAATEVGDTFDVYVQTLIDGTNWIDIAHFTQVLGNGGAKRFVTKIARDLTQTEFNNATALGAALVRNVFGDRYRVRWDITDVATIGNASFTFSVTANFIP